MAGEVFVVVGVGSQAAVEDADEPFARARRPW